MSRVAAVTGGGRGIGLGICRSLAADGYDLALCGLRDEEAVANVLDELRKAGSAVLYVRADVASAPDRAAFLDAIRARHGRLDLLVNNAGIAPPRRADILDAEEASFDRVIEVNLRGPYFLTQAAARWMIEQSRAGSSYSGCIVNISSFSATVTSVDRGDYCISKAGAAMATRLWAVRLAEFGINVYEVRPGIVRTDMTAPVQARYDRLIQEGILPQARWGLPEDVGRAVAMLARGDLAYSTGQVIQVDGGFNLQRL